MPSRELTIRPLAQDEAPLLRQVVYTAATFRAPAPGKQHPPIDDLLAKPHYAVYLDEWGRPGDRAFVATLDGTAVGGAWSRLFSADRPGQGFVGEDIPELGIGLFDGYRSTGIGRVLMHTLIAQARLDGFVGLSLAVANDNRAKELYESLGFVTHVLVDAGQVMRLHLA